MAEEKLRPVVDWRNRAMANHWRGSAEERRRQGNQSGPKRVLRQARAALKQAVRKAKNDWIFSTVTAVNTKTKSGAAMGGPQAWQAVKKLPGGLQRTKKGKKKRMRAANGKMITSAEEDPKIFEAHFKALYERKPEYDLAVLAKIAQRKVRQDLDSEPTLWRRSRKR
jgi:hypothetical protein